MTDTTTKLALAACGAALIFAFAVPRNMARASDCEFSAPLQSLAAIQNDPTLTDHERLVKELDARKQILNDIVGCAITDASSLKTSLSNLSLTDTQNAHLETQLLNRINDSLNFYNLRHSMIGDLGLQGTKDFSNELESWRTNTEAPLEAQIGAFLLWENNQPLLSAAKTRLMQITHALVGLDISTSGDIPKNLDDAKAELDTASDFDQKAGALIASGNSQDAVADIAQFLGALKNTYQDFFSLSDNFQKTFKAK